MTEAEAYPNRSYQQRVATWYQAGDRVTVGPAYRGNGEYISDGYSGPYTVVKKIDSASDYKIIRGDVLDGADWDLIVNASRLTRR